MASQYRDYGYEDASAHYFPPYLLAPTIQMSRVRPGDRVLDVGCGNGFLAGRFLALGCKVVGVDLSESGIQWARRAYPTGRFEVVSADESILDRLGEEPFDVVVSTEVVEHLYDPGGFARGCYAALRSDGRFVCSTPYHGYLKSLSIAALNRFDSHVNPLWDGGHIKFWSRRTLYTLLERAGFTDFEFRGAGRAPFLWKSMIVAARRPR